MKIFAHRGVSAHYPENSQEAILQCDAPHINGIEIDIFQAGDEFIVFHDRWLTRILGIDKKTTELTAEDLLVIKGNDGHPIPTLEWLLTTLSDKPLLLNIELKQIADINLFLTQLNTICDATNYPFDNIIISSFNHLYLQQLSLKTTRYKLGLLLATHPIDIQQYLSHFPIFSVHLDMDCVSATLVAQIQQLGLEVFIFTVDHRREINWCIEHKVDGIFANDPLHAYKVLNNLN